MVYVKYPSFKTGINPSMISQFYKKVPSDFNIKNLTGTQKVLLAGSRIFGYNIGGNYSSGQKQIRQALIQKKRLIKDFYTPFWDVKSVIPYIQYEEQKERNRMVLEKRRIRILMRGVKLGKKKGAEKIEITETMAKKQTGQGQAKQQKKK